ncbi:unnamed protein product [Clonostachys chloroleuca]|uniref:CHK kinase-like domain-containing protein n=1 Tax=Clonostachys chloroleuca TaxID=1926264 RepID=A0AA35QD52_9HYPO|nr:unnamed protein product [Clonostachys chloroleuca]
MPETTTTSKLPSVPEEVTTEWLSSVLKLPIKSSEITKSILNQTASKVYVTLTYEDGPAGNDRPEHVCLKGGFNPEMVNMEGYKEALRMAYMNEINFFNIVAPRLSNVALVKVWWAAMNTEQGQAISIMEDLSLENTFGEPTEAWSVDMVKQGVVELAGLHASTWGATTDDADYSRLQSAYDFVIMSLTENWDMIVGENRPPFPESIRDQKRLQAALSKHLKTHNPKFLAVTHSDPHCGNTWITSDGKPRFLDWQTVQLGSVFHDVAYFILGALPVEERRKHEFEILEHYLEAVARFGGPKLSIKDEEVVTEYKKNAMSGIGWCLTPFELQRKERVFAMCERYSAAMEDHDMMKIIEALPEPQTNGKS